MENEQPQEKTKPSDLFRLWADKIDKNDQEDFSGAFMIIPPVGDPISSLLIDQDKDIGNFFALVKTKIEAAVDAINDQQKKLPGYR